MIATIVLWLFIAALLDTLIGNRIWPSRVEVLLKRGHWYIVMKVHRVFFIPVKLYIIRDDTRRTRTFLEFTWTPRDIAKFDEKEAIYFAKVFSNKEEKEEDVEIVWSSKTKEEKKQDELDVNAVNAIWQEIFNQKTIEDKLPLFEKLEKLRKN